MSEREAWREVCMAEYRITGDMLKATAFADSVKQRIRVETLREAADWIELQFPDPGGDQPLGSIFNPYVGSQIVSELRRMADER